MSGDTPLFTTFLNYRHVTDERGAGRHALEGLRTVYTHDRSNYPLSAAVNDDGHGIELVIDAVAPIDPQAVAGLLHTATENLASALESALDGGPEARLSAVPVPTSEQRRNLLVGRNDTARDLGPALVPELFEARVQQCPDAVALTDGDSQVSYAELDERAGALAHYLTGQGIGGGQGAGAESLVALCLPRGIDMVVAMLATWKAQAAYLPIDPEYPAERIAFLLADSGAALLLTDEETLEDLPAGRVRMVALDDPPTAAQLAAAPAGAPGRATRPDALAYVIYTSGSTGTPKGVAVPHGGLANYVAWAAGAYEAAAHDGGAPLHSSLAFDLTVTSVLLPLVAGTPVVHQPPRRRRGPGRTRTRQRPVRAGQGSTRPPPAAAGTAHPGRGGRGGTPLDRRRRSPHRSGRTRLAGGGPRYGRRQRCTAPPKRWSALRPRGTRRVPGGVHGAHRTPRRQHPALRAGRGAAAGARRGGRRAVHRRRRLARGYLAAPG